MFRNYTETGGYNIKIGPFSRRRNEAVISSLGFFLSHYKINQRKHLYLPPSQWGNVRHNVTYISNNINNKHYENYPLCELMRYY